MQHLTRRRLAIRARHRRNRDPPIVLYQTGQDFAVEVTIWVCEPMNAHPWLGIDLAYSTTHLAP